MHKSWAIVAERDKDGKATKQWLVDDFTLEEIDALAAKHNAGWGDVEFNPGANVELLHDLICAGCDKLGAEKPPKPKKHGDRMRLLEMIERDVDVPLAPDMEINEKGAVPLDDGQEPATNS